MTIAKALKSLLRMVQSNTARQNPDSGERLLYPKSDGWYDRDSAGVETKLGGGGASAQDFIDGMWNKKFFSDAGYLPANKIFEYTGTPPAFAGTPSGSFTREAGAARAGGSAIAYYDMGASKSELLIVVGCVSRVSGNILNIGITDTAPAGLDPTNSYSFWDDGSGFRLWRKIGAGAYTVIDGGNLGYSAADFCGLALYYKDSTNDLRTFFNFGTGWHQNNVATDSNLTTMRYIYFQAGAANQRWITPFVCYAA